MDFYFEMTVERFNVKDKLTRVLEREQGKLRKEQQNENNFQGIC